MKQSDPKVRITKAVADKLLELKYEMRAKNACEVILMLLNSYATTDNDIDIDSEEYQKSTQSTQSTQKPKSKIIPKEIRQRLVELEDDMLTPNMWTNRNEVHEVILDLKEIAVDYLAEDKVIAVHDKLIDIMNSFAATGVKM